MVEIVSYKEYWPRDFAKIGAALRNALGDLAARIDHIGSTSVPDLASKDRIDIQLTIQSFGSFQPIQAALESLGYSLRVKVTSDHVPPGIDTSPAEWEKRYFGCPPKQRDTNLHVRVQGRANQRYALLFRDYLRQHPKCAAAYAELKRRLAQYHGDDSLVYSTIKDPACDIIMSAAEDWAKRTDWQPGPTDA